MIAFVADTHAFIWHLFVMLECRLRRGEHSHSRPRMVSRLGVSSVTLAEIVYLMEKGRISANALAGALAILLDPEREVAEVPFDSEIVLKMREVSRQEVPDMPDRIVAAAGLRYGVPVISKDARIRTAILQTIW